MSKLTFNSFISISLNEESNISRNNVNNAYLNGITVTYSDDFDCVIIKDCKNKKVGMLIGNPVSGSSFLVEDVRIDGDSWEIFENSVYEF